MCCNKETCCKNPCHQNNCNKFSLKGESNSLYYVDDDAHFRSIKLVDEIGGADIIFELSSVDETNNHSFLSSYLNKNIEISIKVLED